MENKVFDIVPAMEQVGLQCTVGKRQATDALRMYRKRMYRKRMYSLSISSLVDVLVMVLLL